MSFRGSAGRKTAKSAKPPSKKQLSNAEKDELREIFGLVDKDGGGTISAQELGELFETLGIRASKEELVLMIEEVDADRSGEIDFDEFLQVMAKKVSTTYTSTQVKRAFKVFAGASNDGCIKVDAVVTALTTYGSEKLTKMQAQELVAQLEADESGTIKYEEFVDMMMDDR